MNKLFFFLFATLIATQSCSSQNIHWPTPNKAFFQNLPAEYFIQPTVSGKIISGKFGCVRNGGKKFHEGIDLKPIKRDSNGEAADYIFSVMPGKVVHINKSSGNSTYGKYIVIQHNSIEPNICTLYAHLSKILPTIEIGSEVEAGTPIAVMGRTTLNSNIPKTRAHLHFEMGLMFTDNFNSWYYDQKYTSRNPHGKWNGQNIQGFNPLDFFTQLRSGKISHMSEYLKGIPIAFKLRIYDPTVPNFIKRYPSLLNKRLRTNDHHGWEIGFTWYGLPTQWESLSYNDSIRNNNSNISLVAYDKPILKATSCRKMIVFDKNDKPQLGSNLKMVLSLLFDY